MDSEGFTDDLFKIACRFENFNLDISQKPLNLAKEDYWSTLTKSYPCDDDLTRTNEIIKKFITTQQLTVLYLKLDVLQLTDVFENFVEKSALMYGIIQFYSYPALGYTWKAGLKFTKIKSLR